jgi:cysteinyl-tRNA synthetase
MHNGFLMVEGEKMSKSLGNFITIHQLLDTEDFGGKRWPGEVLRLAMLETHYRQPIDFTVKALEVAEKVLNNWYKAVGDAKPYYYLGNERVEVSDWMHRVVDALRNDMNTHDAISVLNSASDFADEEEYGRERFKIAANLLGLLQMTESEWKAQFRSAVAVSDNEIMKAIAARLAARAAKNWKEADRIRDELAEQGIVLKDGKDPATGEVVTTWEVAR